MAHPYTLRDTGRSYDDAGVMKTTEVPTPWKVPAAETRTKSKWQVTRPPTGGRFATSVFGWGMGTPPVGVKVELDLSAGMTKVAVLPTTCPGVKFPLPLRATSTDCPLSQVSGILVLLGSAEAAGARAMTMTAPEMSETTRRWTMG